MDFVLSLSLVFLLNCAGLSECRVIADEAASTASSSTVLAEATTTPGTGISSEAVKETLEKREIYSDASSDTSAAYPVDETLKSNPTTAAEEEATSSVPLIIDLGNIPNIRLRRSDSNEFTDSAATDQDGGPTGDDSDAEIGEDPVDQESEDDPANMREERHLDSDEMLEGVGQGRMFDGSDHRQMPLVDRRYWSSEENRPRRHFITVPIFPGR
ncbi:uncharacterized protein LOC144473580 [Augochlora pura]